MSEAVDLTCPVPSEHCYWGGRITAELDDPTIPCTYNGCCSPECGNWIDGYLAAAAPGDPVRDHWQRNIDAGEAAVRARKDAIAACDHREWVENGGSYFESAERDDAGDLRSVRFQSLRCLACLAVKPGDRIEAGASR